MDNSMDRGSWWSAVHEIAQSWTQLKLLSMCTYIYMCVCVCVCEYQNMYICWCCCPGSPSPLLPTAGSSYFFSTSASPLLPYR